MQRTRFVAAITLLVMVLLAGALPAAAATPVAGTTQMQVPDLGFGLFSRCETDGKSYIRLDLVNLSDSAFHARVVHWLPNNRSYVLFDETVEPTGWNGFVRHDVSQLGHATYELYVNGAWAGSLSTDHRVCQNAIQNQLWSRLYLGYTDGVGRYDLNVMNKSPDFFGAWSVVTPDSRMPSAGSDVWEFNLGGGHDDWNQGSASCAGTISVHRGAVQQGWYWFALPKESGCGVTSPKNPLNV